MLSVVWALFVFVLVPKQLGLSLSIMANGFPDVVYLLIASASVGLSGRSSRRSGRTSSFAQNAAMNGLDE